MKRVESGGSVASAQVESLIRTAGNPYLEDGIDVLLSIYFILLRRAGPTGHSRHVSTLSNTTAQNVEWETLITHDQGQNSSFAYAEGCGSSTRVSCCGIFH